MPQQLYNNLKEWDAQASHNFLYNDDPANQITGAVVGENFTITNNTRGWTAGAYPILFLYHIADLNRDAVQVGPREPFADGFVSGHLSGAPGVIYDKIKHWNSAAYIYNDDDANQFPADPRGQTLTITTDSHGIPAGAYLITEANGLTATNGTTDKYIIGAQGSFNPYKTLGQGYTGTAAAVATSFTLTVASPASGVVGVASANFTLTPVGGNYTGTITPTAASGTFTPASRTWTGDAAAKTFTYTPASAGAKTISATANPTLTAPASVSYTATAAPQPETLDAAFAGFDVVLLNDQTTFYKDVAKTQNAVTAGDAVKVWADKSGNGHDAVFVTETLADNVTQRTPPILVAPAAGDELGETTRLSPRGTGGRLTITGLALPVLGAAGDGYTMMFVYDNAFAGSPIYISDSGLSSWWLRTDHSLIPYQQGFGGRRGVLSPLASVRYAKNANGTVDFEMQGDGGYEHIPYQYPANEVGFGTTGAYSLFAGANGSSGGEGYYSQTGTLRAVLISRTAKTDVQLRAAATALGVRFATKTKNATNALLTIIGQGNSVLDGSGLKNNAGVYLSYPFRNLDPLAKVADLLETAAAANNIAPPAFLSHNWSQSGAPTTGLVGNAPACYAYATPAGCRYSTPEACVVLYEMINDHRTAAEMANEMAQLARLWRTAGVLPIVVGVAEEGGYNANSYAANDIWRAWYNVPTSNPLIFSAGTTAPKLADGVTPVARFFVDAQNIALIHDASSINDGPHLSTLGQSRFAVPIAQAIEMAYPAIFPAAVVVPGTVATPTFSPVAGAYEGTQTIALSCATGAGATIHYTRDGTTPTSASPTYTAPLSVTVGSTTIKQLATKAGLADSAVASAAYVVTAAPAPSGGQLVRGEFALSPSETGSDGNIDAFVGDSFLLFLTLHDTNGDAVPLPSTATFSATVRRFGVLTPTTANGACAVVAAPLGVISYRLSANDTDAAGSHTLTVKMTGGDDVMTFGPLTISVQAG